MVVEYLIDKTSAAGLPVSRLSQTPLCRRRQKTGSRTKPVGLHSSQSLEALIASPQTWSGRSSPGKLSSSQHEWRTIGSFSLLTLWGEWSPMSLARSMICVRMVNNCRFRDLLMSKVLPARDSGMALSDPPEGATGWWWYCGWSS